MNTSEKIDLYNVEKSIRKQIEFAKMNSLPLFVPKNGVCFSCGMQIYSKKGSHGITVIKASNELITGCPHCNQSFCN